jgi:tRNA (adenine57-N1/adenine58-N1)-methyltransferase catalytic subunit
LSGGIDKTLFAPGQSMLLVDEKDRNYLITVPDPEESVQVKGETLNHDLLCALHDGELLVTSRRRFYLAFKPTMEQVVMNMPRQAQVIFPKDLAMILQFGDVAPGQEIIEVGAGHGALTMALLRALGPTGSLVSFDIRQDHLNRTRKNIAQYLGEEALENWQWVMADPAEEGFGERQADRVFTDVPEPWEMAQAVADALRPGGVWTAFLPTALQMMNLVEALKADKAFALPQAFETLQRYWHIKAPSLRPSHNMRGHTGFIVLARRRWRQED